MTLEEKLNKTKEFIKHIADMQLPIVTSSDIVCESHPYCEECGGECELGFVGPHLRYVEESELNSLKDQAWHLLADLID